MNKSRLYSWNETTQAWVAIDEGPVRAMHDGAARRYDTARKHGLTGAAFLPWLGGVPVGTPEKFGVEVVGAEPESVRTAGTELDGGLVALEGLAATSGPARDLTPAQAQAVLVDYQRLRAMEGRAQEIIDNPADWTWVGQVGSVRYVLTGETS